MVTWFARHRQHLRHPQPSLIIEFSQTDTVAELQSSLLLSQGKALVPSRTNDVGQVNGHHILRAEKQQQSSATPSPLSNTTRLEGRTLVRRNNVI